LTPPPKPKFLGQLGWLVVIWTASVAALALAALILRGVMAMAGMVR
jgi:hypothetical protein